MRTFPFSINTSSTHLDHSAGTPRPHLHPSCSPQFLVLARHRSVTPTTHIHNHLLHYQAHLLHPCICIQGVEHLLYLHSHKNIHVMPLHEKARRGHAVRRTSQDKMHRMHIYVLNTQMSLTRHLVRSTSYQCSGARLHVDA